MTVRVEQVTPWLRALNAARWTMGKAPLNKEPSNEWKDKIIRAEHSPIRLVEFDIWLEDNDIKVSEETLELEKKAKANGVRHQAKSSTPREKKKVERKPDQVKDSFSSM